MVRLILGLLVASICTDALALRESTADRIRQDETRLYFGKEPPTQIEPDAGLVDEMFGAPKAYLQTPRYSPVPPETAISVRTGTVSLEDAVSSIAASIGFTPMYLNRKVAQRLGYIPKVRALPLRHVLALVESIFGVRIYEFPESRLLMVSADGS